MMKKLLAFVASILIFSCNHRSIKSRDACRIAPIHDYGSPFNADFCRHADRVVVGVVESSRSRHSTKADHLTGIVSDVQVRITHVLSGPDSAGEAVELTVDAEDQGDGVTTTGGISDGLSLKTGTRYLLFLSTRAGEQHPSVLAKKGIARSIEEKDLDLCVFTDRWKKVCAANPEGIHTEDIIWSNLGFLFGDCPLKLHR